MIDPQTKLHEVSWGDVFRWLILFRSVRITLLVRVLVLAAAGLILTTLGWRVINAALAPKPVTNDDPTVRTSADDVLKKWREDARKWAWEGARGTSSVESAQGVLEYVRRELFRKPLSMWDYLTRPFRDMFKLDLSARGFFCLLACGIWELLVWGVVGGAIARIAALRFTRGEAPGLVAALLHSGSKLLSFSVAPLVALAGAAAFAGQLFVLGLVMNVGFFALLAGLAWPFVLLLGILMAVLLVGALVGWPLMWATVAVEGTDAFDALSRSYAYVYQRPWRLLWYVLVAVFVAAVSYLVVTLFAAAAINLGDWSIDWGLGKDTFEKVVLATDASGDAPADMPAAFETPGQPGGGLSVATPSTEEQQQQLEFLEKSAMQAIYFWKSILWALVGGYQVGFLWVAAVGVYLLLRRDIDGAEMDEVFVEQQVEFGMPPLESDAATGVPTVSPGAPAKPGDTAMPN